jgi:hypothetical protein
LRLAFSLSFEWMTRADGDPKSVVGSEVIRTLVVKVSRLTQGAM